MNASQPEADTEYSTPAGGQSPPGRPSARTRTGRRGGPLALALLGVGLLVAAEFVPLLHVRTLAAHPRLVRTVQGGPHHGWALLVLAVLAAGLTVLAARGEARAPWILIAVLALGALGIAVFADLPDAHATGLVGSSATGLSAAEAHAAVGLYLETLGAVALLLAGTIGATLRHRRTPSNGRRGTL